MMFLMRVHIFLLLLVFLGNSAHGQKEIIAINRVEDKQLIKFSNNSELLSQTETEEISIRIFMVDLGSGSAGFESGETAHNLLIAVSAFDEYPEQSLFEVGSFYNPMKVNWTKNQFELWYGELNEPKKIIFLVSIDKITEIE